MRRRRGQICHESDLFSELIRQQFGEVFYHQPRFLDSSSPRIFSSDSSAAAAKAAIMGVFSVPERNPSSCPPPKSSGFTLAPDATYSAPIPLGSVDLVPREAVHIRAERPEIDLYLAESLHAVRCGTAPWGSRVLVMRTSLAISLTAPVSLLDNALRDTSEVFGVSNFENASSSTPPSGFMGANTPHRSPVARAALSGIYHRVMLPFRDDDAAALRLFRAEQRRIVRLRAARGEVYLSSARAQDIRQFAARRRLSSCPLPPPRRTARTR